MKKTSAKSVIFLLLTAIVWGFAFVAQKLGGDDMSPFWFNGIRFIIGTVSLIPVVLIFEKEKKDTAKFLRTIRSSAICAAFLFIASALQQAGINMTGDSGKAGFITALYTVLVPIFCFLLFKQKTALSTWTGAVFAVVGIFLLSINKTFGIASGDLVLLAGSVFWAFHIIAIDRLVNNVSAIKFAMFQAFFCGVYNLIFAAFTPAPSPEIIMNALIPILYCGIGSVGVAYTCQILGQKDAEPTFATIILSMESVFSVIGGAIIDGEKMPVKGYVGCLLIFAGVLISQNVFSKKKT